MENSNDDRMPIKKPRTWNSRDMYKQYAQYILDNDPQCWGKYSRDYGIKNCWIYKTVDVGKQAKVVEVMSYDRWKAIMTAYFLSARNRIIEHGEGLSMGLLGIIKARRCERNHKNKAINWCETSKRPKVMNDKGAMVPDKYIYFTEDDYIRIAWRKYHSHVNEKYYEFDPSAGDTERDGFRQQFSRANKDNPILKFRYDYYPHISLVGEMQTEEDDIPVMQYG